MGAPVPNCQVQPGYAEAFMPNGRPPNLGDYSDFLDHAVTLEAIAAAEGDTIAEIADNTRSPLVG